MIGRTDGLRVMWERTPFPLMQTTGPFAPHSANNVYIVARRHPSENGLRAVYVGSGAAMDELIQCASREGVKQHGDERYELIAFSCYVGDALREGTERFLANDLSPLLSEQAPNARSNRINLPAVQWEKPGKGIPGPLRKAG
jgi:hypothetical protein